MEAQIRQIYIHTEIINEISQLIDHLLHEDEQSPAMILLQLLFLTYRLYREILLRKVLTDSLLLMFDNNTDQFLRVYYETLEQIPEQETRSIIQNKIIILANSIQNLVDERQRILRNNIQNDEMILIRDLIQQEVRALFHSSSSLNEFNETFHEFSNRDIWPRLRRPLIRIERRRLDEADCSESECAFCMEPLMDSSRIKLEPCHHCFHARCPSGHVPLQFFNNYGACPLCRSEPQLFVLTE